ncbi:MAG: PH domain-containing protein [Planctomycetes bacterium]|nr:PH domain-containing protein [Planctomycetota bacterium]
MPAAYCASCGAALVEGAEFCHKCGARRAGAAERPRVATPEPAATGPEEELWRGGYSGRALAPAWLFCVVFAGAVLASALLLLPPAQSSYRLALTALAFFPALWVTARFLAARLSVRYRLTSERLFLERGILSREMSEIELVRVDDVTVHQSLIERMVNVGKVTLATTDASDPGISLESIDRPLEVKETIRAAVRRQRSRVLRMESV